MNEQTLTGLTARDLVDLLSQQYSEAGLKLILQQSNYVVTDGSYVALTVISINKDSRKKGVGGSVMQTITRWANINHKTIGLTPTNEFGSGVAELYRFYGRFGFSTNKGKDKDFTIMESMYRLPQKIN